MIEFETKNLTFFEKQVGRLPREAKNAVRRSNRKWAATLRNLIRTNPKTPRTGRSASREGSKHDTPHGAIRRSIRSKAGTNYALVEGGRPKAPHLTVHEFGGGVTWRRGEYSHKIPVKARTAQYVAPGARRGGAGGTFFFPTVRKHVDEIAEAAMHEALSEIRRTLSKVG